MINMCNKCFLILVLYNCEAPVIEDIRWSACLSQPPILLLFASLSFSIKREILSDILLLLHVIFLKQTTLA